MWGSSEAVFRYYLTMYPAFTSGIEMAEDIPSQQECNLERTVTAAL
jgi:hypothetical protein